jgi:hypothetical protein
VDSFHTAANLFNPIEGLNMEKTAHAFFYQGMKSLPIKTLRRTPKQIRDEERKPLILRNYTLCEVQYSDEQLLPVGVTSSPTQLTSR